MTDTSIHILFSPPAGKKMSILSLLPENHLEIKGHLDRSFDRLNAAMVSHAFFQYYGGVPWYYARYSTNVLTDALDDGHENHYHRFFHWIPICSGYNYNVLFKAYRVFASRGCRDCVHRLLPYRRPWWKNTDNEFIKCLIYGAVCGFDDATALIEFLGDTIDPMYTPFSNEHIYYNLNDVRYFSKIASRLKRSALAIALLDAIPSSKLEDDDSRELILADSESYDVYDDDDDE